MAIGTNFDVFSGHKGNHQRPGESEESSSEEELQEELNENDEGIYTSYL